MKVKLIKKKNTAKLKYCVKLILCLVDMFKSLLLPTELQEWEGSLLAAGYHRGSGRSTSPPGDHQSTAGDVQPVHVCVCEWGHVDWWKFTSLSEQQMQVACVQKGLCAERLVFINWITISQCPHISQHKEEGNLLPWQWQVHSCTVHCGLGLTAIWYRLGLEAIQLNLRSFQLHTCTHRHSTKANDIQHLSTYLACRKKPALALQTAFDILSKLLHPPLCTRTSLHFCSSKEFPVFTFSRSERNSSLMYRYTKKTHTWTSFCKDETCFSSKYCVLTT